MIKKIVALSVAVAVSIAAIAVSNSTGKTSAYKGEGQSASVYNIAEFASAVSAVPSEISSDGTSTASVTVYERSELKKTDNLTIGSQLSSNYAKNVNDYYYNRTMWTYYTANGILYDFDMTETAHTELGVRITASGFSYNSTETSSSAMSLTAKMYVCASGTYINVSKYSVQKSSSNYTDDKLISSTDIETDETEEGYITRITLECVRQNYGKWIKVDSGEESAADDAEAKSNSACRSIEADIVYYITAAAQNGATLRKGYANAFSLGDSLDSSAYYQKVDGLYSMNNSSVLKSCFSSTVDYETKEDSLGGGALVADLTEPTAPSAKLTFANYFINSDGESGYRIYDYVCNSEIKLANMNNTVISEGEPTSHINIFDVAKTEFTNYYKGIS